MAPQPEKPNNIGRTVAILSGMGSFLMSIMAVIGVIVYQTNSNTELKTEVRYVREELPTLRTDIKKELEGLGLELKDSRKDLQSQMNNRLENQDQKIENLQEEVNELKVRVKVLEQKGE